MIFDFILLDISNGWKTAIMVVALIAVFYFFMIRPQSQQAKKEEAYRRSLKPGDRVMTAGGIHVTVKNTTQSEALVEAASGVNMKVQLTTLQPLPEDRKN